MDVLRHLRHFVAVAEELHFGRAAEHLGMAQPPLSQSVQRLERHLGLRLLERDSRRVAITPAGRVVLAESQDLLGHVDQFLDRVAAARAGGTGGVRAGLPSGLEPGRVAQLVERFARAEPDVPLHLTEVAHPALRAALQAGHLDIAVLPSPPEDPALQAGTAIDQHLGVLVAAGSSLTHRRAVHLADLGEQPLVLPEGPEDPTAHALIEACRRGGYRPAQILHAGGVNVAIGLILASKAVGLAAAHGTANSALTWLPLLGKPLRRVLVPAWHEGLDPTIAQNFCTALTEAFLSADPPGDIPIRSSHPRAASGFLT